MNIFKKIIEKIKVYKALYSLIRLDNYNKKLFLHTIQEETSDRKSEFVKLGLKLGDDRESVVSVVKVPLEVQEHGDEYLIQDKLWEGTYFLTDFLQKKAKFYSYVSSTPEFFHIEDPTSSDISLTYLAKWNFVPVVASGLKRKLYIVPSVISFILVVGICVGVFLF